MGPNPTAQAVLHLQRTAGNRAVVRSLGAPPSRMLARYESPEHIDIGDRHARELGDWVGTEEGRAWVAQYGLENDVRGLSTDWYARGQRRIGGGAMTLSPGEIIALSGDFYEHWEQLRGAPLAELRDLLGAIGQERAGQLSNANATYEGITARHRKDSRDHYLELAKRNTPHFTPGNRRKWREMHEEALEMAKRPGVTRFDERRFSGAQTDPGAAHDERFETALMIDAAAGHFLTDAFAAGHLFDKDRLMAQITLRLRASPARPENPEMGGYFGVIQAAGGMELAVLKNVHDRLNREGFEVTNRRGMRWRTFGDDHLHEATETQRIAALAIYVSRQQVFAARAGRPANPDDVLAFFPDEASIERATQTAISYIPAAVAGISDLIYSQRSMAPTQFGPILGAIIESNIATIGAPNRERQLLDVQERARSTGTPQVAPQFTVFDW